MKKLLILFLSFFTLNSFAMFGSLFSSAGEQKNMEDILSEGMRKQYNLLCQTKEKPRRKTVQKNIDEMVVQLLNESKKIPNSERVEKINDLRTVLFERIDELVNETSLIPDLKRKVELALSGDKGVGEESQRLMKKTTNVLEFLRSSFINVAYEISKFMLPEFDKKEKGKDKKEKGKKKEKNPPKEDDPLTQEELDRAFLNISRLIVIEMKKSMKVLKNNYETILGGDKEKGLYLWRGNFVTGSQHVGINYLWGMRVSKEIRKKAKKILLRGAIKSLTEVKDPTKEFSFFEKLYKAEELFMENEKQKARSIIALSVFDLDDNDHFRKGFVPDIVSWILGFADNRVDEDSLPGNFQESDNKEAFKTLRRISLINVGMKGEFNEYDLALSLYREIVKINHHLFDDFNEDSINDTIDVIFRGSNLFEIIESLKMDINKGNSLLDDVKRLIAQNLLEMLRTNGYLEKEDKYNTDLKEFEEKLKNRDFNFKDDFFAKIEGRASFDNKGLFHSLVFRLVTLINQLLEYN